MKHYIERIAVFIQTHTEEIGYSTGTGTIGWITYKWAETYVVPVIVAAVCAAVGAYVQHHVKRWLNTRSNKLPDFRSNGRDK